MSLHVSADLFIYLATFAVLVISVVSFAVEVF